MDRKLSIDSRSLKQKSGLLADWIDARTGMKGMLRQALDEGIPGGARAAYVFGSGLLFIFLLQMITGVSLALYYTPTAETAHTSVAYITKQVAGGAFLRSLHSYGSSAMIVVLGLHFMQVFFFGSFKGRRELLWISGAVLSFLILGMGFTGYLLPWDQKAYFATAVGTNVAGQMPLVGEMLTRFLRGGDTIGTLTLSRFYVAHVFLIPATIFLFIGAHILLFRKAGPAGPVQEDPIAPRLASETFYPRQMLFDMGFALLIVAALCGLAYLRPVTLGPIANPSDSHFLPRPEWYYLPMFQWLKYWEGPAVVVGVVVIPGLLATAFFLMPFLDRSLERKPWRRPIPALAVSIVVAGMIFLGVKSQIDDNQGPVAAQLNQQRAEEVAYSAAPFEPYTSDAEHHVIPAGFAPDPRIARGKGIFIAKGCVGCHGSTGTGSATAPSLIGVGRKYEEQQIIALLHNLNPRMRAAGMPAVDPVTTDVDALFTYLQALGTPAAAIRPQFDAPAVDQPRRLTAPSPTLSLSRISVDESRDPSNLQAAALAGKQTFLEHGCIACHGKNAAGGRAPALAPLVAKLTDPELMKLFRNPNARMLEGGMPPVDATPEELVSLAAYLRSLPVSAVHTTSAGQAIAPAPQAPASFPSTRSDAENVVRTSFEPSRPEPQPLAPAPASAPVLDTRADAGRAIFKAQGCMGCHGPTGQGTDLAPSLVGVASRFPGDSLSTLLRHPRPKMRAAGMPAPKVDDAGMLQLVAYLTSLSAPSAAQPALSAGQPDPAAVSTGDKPRSDWKPEPDKPLLPPRDSAPGDPLVSRGFAVFHKNACETCHGSKGLHGTIAAPGLAGTASEMSASTLEGLLRHHSPRMQRGGMPLTNFNQIDLTAVVAYIRSLSPQASVPVEQTHAGLEHK